MAENKIRETGYSENKQLPFKEAFDILKLVSEERFGPEGALTRLLELITIMVRFYFWG